MTEEIERVMKKIKTTKKKATVTYSDSTSIVLRNGAGAVDLQITADGNNKPKITATYTTQLESCDITAVIAEYDTIMSRLALFEQNFLEGVEKQKNKLDRESMESLALQCTKIISRTQDPMAAFDYFLVALDELNENEEVTPKVAKRKTQKKTVVKDREIEEEKLVPWWSEENLSRLAKKEERKREEEEEE
jgi:hypothetical protein